jgi:hypothetical protein
MSSGGGGMMMPQDNSMQIEMMRQQQAREERARQEAKDRETREKFQTNLANAVSGATETGRNYAAQRGLAPDDFSSVISNIIQNQKLRVPDLDANPGSYFTDDAFSAGFDNHQNVKRANYNSRVNQMFTPGFETALMPDTADDSIINSILGAQRSSAQQQLDFNRQRGTINDAGYNAATQDLDAQGNAGRATLTGIGDAILGKNRQALRDIRGEAGTVASNYTLGMPEPDFAGFDTRARARASSDLAGLEGSIRSALGGVNLFDTSSALAKGGIAQGPINLTTAPTEPGVPFVQKKSTKERGLGSTSTF